MQMSELGQRMFLQLKVESPRKVEKLMYHTFKQFHSIEGLFYGL
jgi:hypothetical protein